MTRRLAGQLNVHSGYLPRPLGSALFRRCVRLPASVYMPMCSQSPESVEPSARRSRNFPTCWPALSTMVFGSFSSLRSSMAQPLISLQSSTCEGLDGFEYNHFSLETAATALLEFGPLFTGFIPKLKKPSILPLYIWSKMKAQLQFS